MGKTKDQFNRYVRGLCFICKEGSFDQALDVLLRAYSSARDDRTITRNEVAAILAKHVVYENSEVLFKVARTDARTPSCETVLDRSLWYQTAATPS